MNIKAHLLNRIAIAAISVAGVTSQVEAMPRLDIKAPTKFDTTWADRNDPLSHYGMLTYNKLDYRAEHDALLTIDQSKQYEALYSKAIETNLKLNTEISQKVILMHALYDLVYVQGDGLSPEQAVAEIRTSLIDFQTDPEAFTVLASSLYEETLQTAIESGLSLNASGDVSPPETKRGALAVLQNAQLEKRQLELNLGELDEVLAQLYTIPNNVSDYELSEVFAKVQTALDENMSNEEALLTQHYLAAQERGQSSEMGL